VSSFRICCVLSESVLIGERWEKARRKKILAQVKGFNCGSVERRTRSQIRLMTRGGGRRRRRRALLWQPPAAPHRSGSARQRKPSRDLNRRKFHQLAARFKAQQEMSPRNPPISSSLWLWLVVGLGAIAASSAGHSQRDAMPPIRPDAFGRHFSCLFLVSISGDMVCLLPAQGATSRS
jgi:hypothetical protein